MKAYFLWGGIALCLFSLWVLARRDWLRLTRPVRETRARVVGYRTGWSDGARTHAAILQFQHEGATMEVTDQVYSTRQHPPAGAEVRICYPEGFPELARPPRPLLWLGIYAFLIGLCILLLAKALTW